MRWPAPSLDVAVAVLPGTSCGSAGSRASPGALLSCGGTRVDDQRDEAGCGRGILCQGRCRSGGRR